MTVTYSFYIHKLKERSQDEGYDDVPEKIQSK